MLAKDFRQDGRLAVTVRADPKNADMVRRKYLPATVTEYDKDGRVWKLMESSQIPIWELGGSCGYLGYTDLGPARRALRGRFQHDRHRR